MSDGRGSKTPKRVNWHAIRTAAGEGVHVAELSRRYGVSEQMIRKRRRMEAASGSPWPEPEKGRGDPRKPETAPTAPSSKASETNASGSRKPETANPKLLGLAGGSADQRRLPSGPSLPRDPDDELEMLPSLDYDFDPTNVSDEALSTALLALAMKAMYDFNAGRIVPGMNQSHADVLDKVVKSVAKAIDKSRDVAGKKPGIPSVEVADDDNTPWLFVRTIVERPKDLEQA